MDKNKKDQELNHIKKIIMAVTYNLNLRNFISILLKEQYFKKKEIIKKNKYRILTNVKIYL